MKFKPFYASLNAKTMNFYHRSETFLELISKIKQCYEISMKDCELLDETIVTIEDYLNEMRFVKVFQEGDNIIIHHLDDECNKIKSIDSSHSSESHDEIIGIGYNMDNLWPVIWLQPTVISDECYFKVCTPGCIFTGYSGKYLLLRGKWQSININQSDELKDFYERPTKDSPQGVLFKY